MGSNDKRYIGAIIVFVSLLFFFFLPLNNIIQAPSELLGKEINLSLNVLFNVCSNPLASTFFTQCGMISFISVLIIIVVVLGIAMIIRG